MHEVSALASSITRLLAVTGGVVAGITLAYAGFMLMTSQGDPQRVSRAKNAFLGALVGLLVSGRLCSSQGGE